MATDTIDRTDLTEDEYRQYDKEGYLKLGQVASDELVAGMQARIDAIMLGEVKYDKMLFQADSTTGNYEDVPPGGYVGPTLNYRKIQDLEKDPVFLEYMQLPIFRGITRRLVGEDISVFRAMFMNKPAGAGTVLPYHQDGGTQWSLDRENFLTVWTALNDTTVANGCVEIIPGSHKLGLLSERGHTLSEEHEKQHTEGADSVFLEVKAGECILLNNYLLHRSGVNDTEIPRRAFSVVYMEGATQSTRSGNTFPRIFGEGALEPGWAEPVA